jgi:hypothetical protein
VGEVQRQAEAAVAAARDDCSAQLQRHGTALRGELNGLRGKVRRAAQQGLEAAAWGLIAD